MPPRSPQRGQPTKPSRAARGGGKPVKGRGKGPRGKQKSENFAEKDLEEIPPEKAKEETWVDKILIFPPPPDQELHIQLSKERKQKRYEKVFAYCTEEIHSIIGFSFAVRPYLADASFSSSKQSRAMRASFRQGKYLPEPSEKPPAESRAEAWVEMAPAHSIDIENYLHISKYSFFSDLSNLFGTKITSDYVSDPNKHFSKLIESIQESATQLPAKYIPPQPSLPFIICVNGPPCSGATTICQFLMRAYAATVIEAVYVAPPDNVRRRKGSEPETPVESQVEFHLRNSIVVKYSDDKGGVSQIAQIIKECDKTNCIIISGFPSTKTQMTALEKALGANIPVRPNSSRSPEKSKNTQLSIQAFIFSMHTPETYNERKIDPESGCVFSDGFHEPSAAELSGENIIDFMSKKIEIENRLTECAISQTQQISQKAILAWNGFITTMKKSYSVLEVPTFPNDIELARCLDSFIEFIQHEDLHLVERLINPKELWLPAACSDALSMWRICLENFGRPIADQNRLICTIGEKVECLTNSALIRFQLASSLKDIRCSLKKEDYSSSNAFFNKVWDESINTRKKHMKLVKDVVQKSGLVELVFSLMNAPKFVFIALVNKMAYVHWFYMKYCTIFTSDIKYDMFRDPSLIEKPPLFDFTTTQQISNEAVIETCEIPSKPSNEESIKARHRKVEETGLDYLKKYYNNTSTDHISAPNFDPRKASEALGIPVFETSTSFDNTSEYSYEFISFVRKNSSEIIQKECDAMKNIFSSVDSRVLAQEISIINSVFDLQDTLIDYTFSKFAHEMEAFSSSFCFEYDFSMIPPPFLSLAKLANSLETSNAHHLLDPKVVSLLKKSTAGMHGISSNDVVDLIRTSEDEVSVCKLDLCIRILECSECFDPSLFLSLFSEKL